MKSPKSGTRHPSGHPCAPSRMHIFPHFSEFLLIFQHGSMSTEKPTPCVCVCEVFEKTQCGGDGWKERRVAGCEVVQLGCSRLHSTPRHAPSVMHIFTY